MATHTKNKKENSQSVSQSVSQSINPQCFVGTYVYLDVLHVLEVRLELLYIGQQLLVCLGQGLGEGGDGLWRTDARHHVLTLRVDQVLPIQLLLASVRVAGKAYAGATGHTHVAETHGLHVHSRTEQTRDTLGFTVLDGAERFPRVEHGKDGLVQLVVRVLRKDLVVLQQAKRQTNRQIERQADKLY